ncbi:hypothetical protein [Bradyrhizobium sp. LA2.1]|uniref:hypothetical protein n=1 Tax=Bradyrhizobium sp. LA2.1 TaxID=3156376 RepID=UPI0033916936
MSIETTDAVAPNPGAEHRNFLADALRVLAGCVDRIDVDLPVDWVDARTIGDLLTSDEAGAIIGKSADTAVRWFDDAAEEGFALGIRFAGVRLFSLRRLLIHVEMSRGGTPARLACETRAQKLAEKRAAPQKQP